MFSAVSRPRPRSFLNASPSERVMPSNMRFSGRKRRRAGCGGVITLRQPERFNRTERRESRRYPEQWPAIGSIGHNPDWTERIDAMRGFVWVIRPCPEFSTGPPARSRRYWRRRLAAVAGAEARRRLARDRDSSTSSPPAGRRSWEHEPVGAGYAGPGGRRRQGLRHGPPPDKDPASSAVARDRPGTEPDLCASTRRPASELWKHEYPTDYTISYPRGPRCTPIVDGDRVYTLGAMGDLLLLWTPRRQAGLVEELRQGLERRPPVWGFAPTRSSTATS